MAKEVFQRTKPHVNVASAAQVKALLRHVGLSPVGIQQALGGTVVSDPNDRAVIARILTAFATTPHVAAELYDYLGAYAQRFDGED